MAQHCADDHYNNHDGWEATWPMEFRLYKDGTEVAKVLVNMEMEPQFLGRVLPEEVPGEEDQEPVPA